MNSLLQRYNLIISLNILFKKILKLNMKKKIFMKMFRYYSIGNNVEHCMRAYKYKCINTSMWKYVINENDKNSCVLYIIELF